MSLVKTFQRLTSQMDPISVYNTMIDQMGKNFSYLDKFLAILSNLRYGEAVLSNGTVTIFDSRIKSTSLIFLCSKIDSNVGWQRVSLITPGTSFKIQSSSATDGSTVCFLIIDPV